LTSRASLYELADVVVDTSRKKTATVVESVVRSASA
jgi:hypothetical protein